MIGVIVFLSLLTAVYVWVGLNYLRGLFRLPKGNNPREYSVSVIIAARNEEKNIGPCLEALLNQTYPAKKYDIIVVDDQSIDDTPSIVASYIRDHGNVVLFRVQKPNEGWTHKKYALNLGIEKSCGEIIMTTDADCIVKPTWIEEMISYFEPDVGMVVGFSQVGSPEEKRTLFESLQAVDFLSLMSAAAGTIGRGIPWAASGQNLAYRRDAFDQVSGFEKVRHRVSGDDVLLLHLIARETDWRTRFAVSEGSFATTRPQKTVAAFFNQRRRWASNSTVQMRLNKKFFAYLAATFTLNLLLCITISLSFFSQSLTLTPWLCLLAKTSIDFCVMLKGVRLFRRHDLLKYFPIWEIFHVPYIVISGFLGMTGNFTWKERSYNQEELMEKEGTDR